MGHEEEWGRRRPASVCKSLRGKKERKRREEFLHVGPSPRVIHVTKTTQKTIRWTNMNGSKS
jgi:hypothetical protein